MTVLTVNKVKIGLGMVMASFMLSGCFIEDRMAIETIRDTNLKESQTAAYSRALASEYKKIALYEADKMYDVADAGHFARKSMSALQGERPVAERPEEWGLKFDEERIAAARKRLNALMARDAAHIAPSLAARAQAHFDCWIEQVEEGWQYDHIDLCQRNFQKAVIALEQKLTSPNSIYFNVNESQISVQGTTLLKKLVHEAKRQDAPLVSIVGYADTTGTDAHNLRLSLDRADEIARFLEREGYPEERIAISAYGEQRLAVITRDNESKRENRRVEIMFYPHTRF